MKKKITTAAVFVLMIVICLSAVSCGAENNKVDGSYSGEISIAGLANVKATYIFSNDKDVSLIITTNAMGFQNSETFTGTYSINDNGDGTSGITLTFSGASAYIYGGTFTFEKGDGYIMIGTSKLNAQ